MKSPGAVLRTRPESVVEDYGRLMRPLKYDQVLARDQDLALKLNLSWTKYFPACSRQPWQVDGPGAPLPGREPDGGDQPDRGLGDLGGPAHPPGSAAAAQALRLHSPLMVWAPFASKRQPRLGPPLRAVLR